MPPGSKPLRGDLARPLRALALLAGLHLACGGSVRPAPSTLTAAAAPDVARGNVAAPSPTWLRADLAVREIAPGVLLHTSWKMLPEFGGAISSNGLVVLDADEALLVDTAWGDEPTAILLDHVERVHHRRVSHVVVTHSHDDRIGGIREALRRGIAVHELELTAKRAAAEGFPPPTRTFARELSLRVGGIEAQAFFPGAAHAPDNVVVWLPGPGILFGSCMIREASAESVGNRADASLADWPDSLRAVRTRFPRPRVVVPGHGEPGDASLLDRTAELVEAGR